MTELSFSVRKGMAHSPRKKYAMDANCPCTKTSCKYHGDCVACRNHHAGSRHAPFCERSGSGAFVRCLNGFSLFVNWFNGICALICGVWMMLSAITALPLSWNDLMPLSLYDPFPFHDVFFTSHFWPGLALFLVNGTPNITALILRRRNAGWWKTACLVAGILLIAWTSVEMILIPNGLSAFYLALGILQTLSAVLLKIHS